MRKFLIILLIVVTLGMSFGFAVENSTDTQEMIPYNTNGTDNEINVENIKNSTTENNEQSSIENIKNSTTENNEQSSNVGASPRNITSTNSEVSDDNLTATFTDKGTGAYGFTASDNSHLAGYCMDGTKHGPTKGQVYNVSSNTSGISNLAKELFVKYFRYDNSNLMSDAFRTAAYHLIRGDEIILNYADDFLALDLVKSLTGDLDIGDTYTFIEDNIEYTFNFFIGYPSTSDYQRMFFVKYNTSNVNSTNNTTEEPDLNITEPDTNNTTEEPDLNITEPDTNNTTEEPDLSKNKVANNSSSIKAEISKNNDTGAKNSVDNDVSDAINMKKTGIPLIALLILISSIGIILKRRK